MTSTVQFLKSPLVKWKTELPRMNRSCVSPVFKVKAIELIFTLSCHYEKSEEEEKWEVRLNPFGLIHLLFYLEKKNGELRYLGYRETFCCDEEFLCAFNFRRSTFTKNGIWGDEVTMVFVLHEDYDFFGWKLDIVKDEEELSKNMCLLSLSKDIEKLFANEMKNSDLALKCGDRSFFVHKKILSARSDVFAAMFRSGMTESETGVVTIKDMKPSVLEQFLRYLYSGRLEYVCMESVFDLYRTGDKYAVYSLKWKCASFMVDNLSEKTICEVLFLADIFGDSKLLDSAMCFAVERDGFLGSNTWNDFADSNLSLALKVYKAYFMKNCNRSANYSFTSRSLGCG